MYLDPGGVGVNQFHIIFSGPAADLATVRPLVTASSDGGTSQALRQLRVRTGHYTDFVVLEQGTWAFHVATRFGGSRVPFDFSRTLALQGADPPDQEIGFSRPPSTRGARRRP